MHDSKSIDSLRQARDEFAYLIESNASEKAFQTLFTQHPYILSEALPLKLKPIDIVPLGRPGKTEADFIFYPRNETKYGEFGVIELKRPSSPIVTRVRKNSLILTRDAEGAITQATDYLDTHFDATMQPSRSIIFGNKGHIFIVMGLRERHYQFLVNDLLRGAIENRLPANCQFLPYDFVFDKFSSAISTTHIHFLTPSPISRVGVLILTAVDISLLRPLNSVHSSQIYRIVDQFIQDYKRGLFDVPVVVLDEDGRCRVEWDVINRDVVFKNVPFVFLLRTSSDIFDFLVGSWMKVARFGYDFFNRLPFQESEFCDLISMVVTNGRNEPDFVPYF